MNCGRGSWSKPHRIICPMLETTIKLGVSRQTVLQRVKRGELEALLVRQGRRKGLRIKVIDDQPNLFETTSSTWGQYEEGSKNFSKSKSTVQLQPSAIYCCACATA